MAWRAYPTSVRKGGKEMSWDTDVTDGALPPYKDDPRPHGKKKQPTGPPQPGPPQPAKGPSGKQRVQHKLAQTYAPIPYQQVDWPTRSQYLKRLTQLRIEKSSWTPHWADIAFHTLPRQIRLSSSDRNMGYRKDALIINSHATHCLRIAAAGMMSGISSPSRPWFKLTTPDPDLAQFGAVKEWLEKCEDRLNSTFAKSNFYNSAHKMYSDLLPYGTSLCLVEEDAQDGIRCYVQPIGAYSLAQGGDCRVNTAYREISLTIAQVVDKFGLSNCSNWVQWNYRKGNYDLWTYVVHVVEPNRKVDNVRWEAKFKAIRSAWFEMGAFSGSYGFDTSDSGYSGEPLNFLMEGGYDESPMLAPRWDPTGMEDVYGASPGMDCLGDVRMLQKLEQAEAKLLAKLVDPPMKGPAALKTGRPSLLPGDFTAVDDSAINAKLEPMQVVDVRAFETTEMWKRQVIERIDAAYSVDVWQMFAQAEQNEKDPQKTAYEIAAKKEEKLQVLGPMLERLHGEMLNPLINRTFNILMRRGEIPPPPPEVQGQDLRVVYISTAAQAQRAIGVQALQSTVSFIGTLVQMGRQDALDNLNIDKAIEDYGDKVGLRPSLLVEPEQLQAIRQQRAQQAAQQQQAALAEQNSKAAKNLANAPLDGDNGLSRYLEGIGQAAGGVGKAA